MEQFKFLVFKIRNYFSCSKTMHYIYSNVIMKLYFKG